MVVKINIPSNRTAAKFHTDMVMYYIYTPQSALENKQYEIYLDLLIHIDKTVIHNRPDITFSDENKSITKSKELSIEMLRIGKQKKVVLLTSIYNI